MPKCFLDFQRQNVSKLPLMDAPWPSRQPLRTPALPLRPRQLDQPAPRLRAPAGGRAGGAGGVAGGTGESRLELYEEGLASQRDLLLFGRSRTSGRQVAFVASAQPGEVVPTFIESQTKIVPLFRRGRIGVCAIQILPEAYFADLSGLPSTLQGAIIAARTMDIAASLPEGGELDALVVNRQRLDLDSDGVLEVHPRAEEVAEARVLVPEHPQVTYGLAATEGLPSSEKEERRGHAQMFWGRLRRLDRGHNDAEPLGGKIAYFREAFLHHPN